MNKEDFQNGFALGMASGGVVESEYILPIGGEELGGVKNGGNVVINEDGTMTAPASDSGGSGGGISTTAINLLIDILKVGMFTTNVSGKIELLKETLLAGGGSDEPVNPDIPDEPTTTDDITVTDGIMTIVSVGSEITVTDGIMVIL